MTKIFAALMAFGSLLAGRNAMAAEWHYNNIVAPSGFRPWASINAGSGGETVFGVDPGNNALYEGWHPNGTWILTPIYSQAGAQAATVSATYWSADPYPILDIYYVAHADSDGRIRLTSWSLFSGWTTTPPFDTVTNTMNPLPTIATVMYKGELYIFYTSTNNGNDTLKAAWTSDGMNFHTQTLDGVAGYQPTAVWADELRVYYYRQGTLREAHSADGKNWSLQIIDGPGFSGGVGGVKDTVGLLPAAIVYNNSVNVFYTDSANQKLRIAQRAGGNWTRAFVDSNTNLNTQTFKAPVIYGSELEVYYVSATGQLRAAYGTGPNALSYATLDGPGSPGNGSVQDDMLQYVTAVEVNGAGPSVFYLDNVTQKLRNSYWQ